MAMCNNPRHNTEKQLNILLVEDDMTHFMYLSSLLRMRGHHVKVINDGSDVEAACQEHYYDIIFMDLMLPRMDGFEAVKCFDAYAQENRPTIIITSSYAMQDFISRFPRGAVQGFLGKPVDADKLDIVLEGVSCHL